MSLVTGSVILAKPPSCSDPLALALCYVRLATRAGPYVQTDTTVGASEVHALS